VNAYKSCSDFATSSPSSSVGVCSDPCREAATIGSDPTNGEGGFDVFPARLQSQSQREGLPSFNTVTVWYPPALIRLRRRRVLLPLRKCHAALPCVPIACETLTTWGLPCLKSTPEVRPWRMSKERPLETPKIIVAFAAVARTVRAVNCFKLAHFRTWLETNREVWARWRSLSCLAPG